MRKLILLSSVLGLLTIDLALAAPLPAARVVEWGKAGVKGGIPTRAEGRNCQTDDNAVGDGVADDTAAIQACLDNAPDGTAALLPAGTYAISDHLTIPANKTLRGAGEDLTVLRSTYAGAYMSGIVTMATDPTLGAGTWPCPATQIDIVGSPQKGDTTITLSGVSGLATGDVVLVSRLNGAAGDFDDGATIDSSVCGYCGICGGTRLMSQLVEIQSMDAGAGTITVDPPLVHAFEAAFSPSVALMGPMLGSSGIEDLTLDNEGATDGVNIELSFVKDSWVKGVRSRNGHAKSILIRGGFRDTVHGSFISTDAFSYTSGGIPDHNYGVSLETTTSSCLVENNRFDNVLVGPAFDGGPGAANVVAYNYSNRQYYCGSGTPDCTAGSYDSEFLQASVASHSSHTTFNLFEGNQIRKIMADDIHGSSAYGVLLRNSVIGESNWVPNEHDLQKTWGLWLVMFQATSTHYSVVGNVIGYSGMSAAGYLYESSNGVGSCGDRDVYNLGWGNIFACSSPDPVVVDTLYRHGNFDYVNNTTLWDASNSDHVLPSSLYLLDRPAWWCAETPWPAIGPDLDPMVSDNPAKRLYDGSVCTPVGPPGPTCANQGLTCCAACAGGAHSEYDSTCSGQLCCEACTTPADGGGGNPGAGGAGVGGAANGDDGGSSGCGCETRHGGRPALGLVSLGLLLLDRRRRPSRRRRAIMASRDSG